MSSHADSVPSSESNQIFVNRPRAPYRYASPNVMGKGMGKGKGKGMAGYDTNGDSQSPMVPLTARNPNADESTTISTLIEEVRQTPLSKVWITVGNTSHAVSNGFALTMLLAGKSHIETERVLFEQRNSRRTAFELRGRGRLNQEEQDMVKAAFIDDV